MRAILIKLFAVSITLVTGANAIAADLDGAPAPDFALRSLQGENLRLSEYRSEVVLLNFWSAWCAKCRQAMPVLQSLHEAHRPDGLHVIGVDIQGNPAKARELLAEYALSYPLLMDAEQAVSRLYELNTLPATVLIDRHGNVVSVYDGFKEPLVDQLNADIVAALKD